MAADLTYQEERHLTELLKDAFGNWTDEDLSLIDRAWLRMNGVKFAALVHLAAKDVANTDLYVTAQPPPAEPIREIRRHRSSCVSCGDGLSDDCADEPPEVRDAMKLRCRTCAREMCGTAIPFVGSLQHDTGGGRRVIRETKTH